MSPLPALALVQSGPLDRLEGKWTSLETVETPADEKALEIHERYTNAVAAGPSQGKPCRFGEIGVGYHALLTFGGLTS